MSAPRNRMRDLFDPVPARSRPRSFRNGAILIGLLGLAVISAYTHNIPLINGKPGYAIEADFAAANQVNDRTPVRVEGIEVGTVEAIEAGADPRRESRLRMRITDEDLVIHSDARASIRWKTVLGGAMYVDLEPGSSREPRLDGPIPVSRTSSQSELDDVLRVYDGPTEGRQRKLLKGLAITLGQPDSAGRAIESLRALRTVGRGLKPLRGSQSGELTRLVAATATTTEALGSDIGRLKALVSGGSRTLGAIGARRAELGDTLELSPPSLDETEATMTRLRTTLDHLDPLVDALRPGAQEIGPAALAAKPALDEAFGLLREARPVLRPAAPTFDALRGAGRLGEPFLAGLNPTVNRLNAEIVPYLNERDDETQLLNYQSIGPFFSVLDGAGAGYDSEGFRLRVSTPAGTNTVPLPDLTPDALADLQAVMMRTCTRPARKARCASLLAGKEAP